MSTPIRCSGSVRGRSDVEEFTGPGVQEIARANKQLIAQLIDVVNQGEIDRIADFFSPDYRDHTVGGSRGGSDREHALRTFRELHAAFPDTHHEVLALLAEGDMVVLRTRAAGTHTGAFRGIGATGREVAMETTVLYRVADGQITERWCDGVSAVADQLRPQTSPAAESLKFLRSAGGEWKRDVPGAEYREVALNRVSFTHFRLDPNTAFEEHVHENEQITYVLSGQLDFEIGGAVHSVKEGQAIAIPSGVPHAVRAGNVSTVAVDAWSPPPKHLG